MKIEGVSKHGQYSLDMICAAIDRSDLLESIPEEVNVFPEVVAIPFFKNNQMCVPSVALVGESGRLYLYALGKILTEEELEIIETLTED